MNALDKLISIIVPVYNAENTLHKCIDSIRSQTYSNWELILVDDGSSDSSREICKYYENIDKRVLYFRQDNRGPSRARNIGLDNATGDLVTFCDSDDYVEPQWLEMFVCNYVGNQLIIQGFYCINQGDSKEISFEYEGNIQTGLLNLYKNIMPGALWNKCFDKHVLDEYNIRFNESYRFREDEDFLLKYAMHIHEMKSINYSGYNYVMPEFDDKYKGVDVFDSFMSIYISLKKIFDNKNFIKDMYLRDLAFSLFSSYENVEYNRGSKLYRFYKYIHADVLHVRTIPIHMRLVLGLLWPVRIIHYVMTLYFKFK